MSPWRKFLKLGWRDRGRLLAAVCGLLAIGVLLSLGGFERALVRLRRSSGGRLRRPPTPTDLEDLKHRAWLIAAAARFGPYRATCLRRSMLLWWNARRRGFDPHLRIGVLREVGDLRAHAWVELAGEVLNDRSEVVARYAPFDTSRLPERVSWT